MDLIIEETGIEINLMEKEQNILMKNVNIVDNLTKGKEKDMVYKNLKMVIYIKESGKIICLMDKENIKKKMGRYIQVNGKIVKEMEKENNNGKMVVTIKGIIWMIKKMDMDNINGEVEKNILGIGNQVR